MQMIKNAETIGGVHTHTHRQLKNRKNKIYKGNTNKPIKI